MLTSSEPLSTGAVIRMPEVCIFSQSSEIGWTQQDFGTIKKLDGLVPFGICRLEYSEFDQEAKEFNPQHFH